MGVYPFKFGIAGTPNPNPKQKVYDVMFSTLLPGLCDTEKNDEAQNVLKDG